MARTVSALVALIFVGCSRPPAESSPDNTIPPPREVKPRVPKEALAAGVAYLLKQQSESGAWQSDVYATFKDGTALTPLAVVALQDVLDAGSDSPEIRKAVSQGCGFLTTYVTARGIDPGPDGFEYPVYTAALTIKALSHPSARDFATARDAWVKYLNQRQLTEKLGWKPDDKQYGGWGYCRAIPKKPEPNAFAPPLIESNLSATVFALDALKVAGETDAAVYRAAATFLRRCQNDDGGFHFIYDDPVRNKAGSPDPAGTNPTRFHSYGSTTADGFRALHLCGLPAETARDWLVKNYRADAHPGTYVKAHESTRDAVYFYYAVSISRAFRDHKLPLPDGRDWTAELSGELTKRQKADGSWANPVELVRENEPLVATCNAVSALARCRR